MLKDIKWLLIIVLSISLLCINTLCAKEPEKQRTHEGLYSVTIHSKEANESIWSRHVYPWIPIVSVIIAATLTTILGHLYWIKREAYYKRSKILDEKIRCYINISKHILEYNVYTAVIEAKYAKIDKLKQKSLRNEEELLRIKKVQREVEKYEERRLGPHSGMKQEINNAGLFFSTDKFKRCKINLEELFLDKEKVSNLSPEKYRKKILNRGNDLVASIGQEVKGELEKSKKLF